MVWYGCKAKFCIFHAQNFNHCLRATSSYDYRDIYLIHWYGCTFIYVRYIWICCMSQTGIRLCWLLSTHIHFPLIINWNRHQQYAFYHIDIALEHKWTSYPIFHYVIPRYYFWQSIVIISCKLPTFIQQINWLQYAGARVSDCDFFMGWKQCIQFDVIGHG